MLNIHVNYKFIPKKTRFASYDVICILYITKSILTKQIYLSETNTFKFWSNVSKKFYKCLIRNQIPKYLSKHIENILQVLSSKFEIKIS